MRLQLTPDFAFADAASRLATIATLGVSHVYLSPIAEAVTGSRHGYDVTDHTRVRSDLGGEAGLERLLDAAEERGMGVIVDHVPNHVSVERAELNAPWWETLRGGPDTDAALWFDIDWQATGGKVIVAKLGAPLDEMLDDGDIVMGDGDRGRELRVGDLRFPLAAGTEHLDVRDAVGRQHYRLAFWRDPARNVRRFFTIDDLAAVCVEHAAVAHVVDTLPRNLTAHAAFAGVRVDHVDGLADPGSYLEGLRDVIGEERLLFVEKIVATGEPLPTGWPVDGTTGYEQVTVAEHALLDPAAEEHLMRVWERRSGGRSFADLDDAARAEVLADGLDPDFDRLATAIADALATTASEVRPALDAMTRSIDRYRTYLPDDTASEQVFERVVERASSRPDTDGSAVRAVADTIRTSDGLLARWQQLTGPAVAKGGEDRAFYRWFPLASLCEVGGDPERFSIPVAEFHAAQLARQSAHPTAMLAETTHDTKRSGGVRARSLALAAHAEEWGAVVDTWLDGRDSPGHPALDRDGGLGAGIVDLAMQTAVTARPIDAVRLGDYLVKSAREADLITTWTAPDDEVEAALRSLAHALVDAASSGPLADFADRIEPIGDAAGLGLLALQLTCPGFADLYQGSPRRLLTLVDPDNRGEVDWDSIAATIERVPTADAATAHADGDVDLARTVLTERILRLRRRRPEAFGAGAGYLELQASGPDAEKVIAFARTDGGNAGDGASVVVIVTRVTNDPGNDAEVELPAGTWRSVTVDDAAIEQGGRRRLADLLGASAGRSGIPGVEVLERTDR
ncbi:MAG: malto-oligosyltrehalose synthase [Ilumatobacter sp.]|uniref:malto-oligosyltrehalose synthase n=1 Tax=Ilumatobacter sp. TaxID=1967498 RepID=UPI00329A7247